MTRRRAIVVLTASLAAACRRTRPESIAVETDGCAYCRMQISDRRFAAAILTTKGRTIKFDSCECLVAYARHVIAAGDVASVWVSDFLHPGTLLDAASARFVDLGGGRAPMGGTRGIAAVASAADAATLGIVTTKRWAEVL